MEDDRQCCAEMKLDEPPICDKCNIPMVFIDGGYKCTICGQYDVYF